MPYCEGSRIAAYDNGWTRLEAGVRKPSGENPPVDSPGAVDGVPIICGSLFDRFGIRQLTLGNRVSCLPFAGNDTPALHRVDVSGELRLTVPAQRRFATKKSSALAIVSV